MARCTKSRDGKIVQSTCLWDFLDLIRQAGFLADRAVARHRGYVARPDHLGWHRARRAGRSALSAASIKQTLAMHKTLADYDDNEGLGQRRPAGHAANRALASEDDVVWAVGHRHDSRPTGLRRLSPAALSHRFSQSQGRRADHRSEKGRSLHPDRRRQVIPSLAAGRACAPCMPVAISWEPVQPAAK